MKKLIIYLIIFTLLSSCKKDSINQSPQINEISGFIIEPHLNKPVKGVTIDLLYRKSGGSYNTIKSILTDSLGRFKFNDLPDPNGNYNLDITKPYDVYSDLLNVQVYGGSSTNWKIYLAAHSVLKLNLIYMNRYFPKEVNSDYELYVTGPTGWLPGYGGLLTIENIRKFDRSYYGLLYSSDSQNNIGFRLLKNGRKRDTTIFQYIKGIPADTVEMNFEF